MTQEKHTKQTKDNHKKKTSQPDTKLAHLNEPWRHLYELIQKHVK